MIYLIDDNQNNQRLNQYSIGFVEDNTFTGFLTSISKIEKKESKSDISNLTFLNNNCKCILLHKTMQDWDNKRGFLDSTDNVTKITDEISDKGDKIPLVLFSNSMDQPEYFPEKNKNFIPAIKKNLLYERLWDFVEYYKKTEIIELRILVFGKYFITQKISSIALELLNQILKGGENKHLKLSDFGEKTDALKTFLDISFHENSVNIIDQIDNNPITICEFQNKITMIEKSFIKYGKNIYPW